MLPEKVSQLQPQTHHLHLVSQTILRYTVQKFS